MQETTAQSTRIERAFSKQMFREMIKMQIDDGPLPWSRRRELVRFASRLGIDAFEAKLIIRAVEYECGVAAPAALDDRESPADTHLVTAADESFGALAPKLLVPVAIILIILSAWLALGRV